SVQGSMWGFTWSALRCSSLGSSSEEGPFCWEKANVARHKKSTRNKRRMQILLTRVNRKWVFLSKNAYVIRRMNTKLVAQKTNEHPAKAVTFQPWLWPVRPAAGVPMIP